MAGSGDGNDRLVYSSGQGGRMCPECGRTEARCRCRGKSARTRIAARATLAAAEASDGILRVGRTTKGRKGKTVSTVTGAPPGEQSQLTSELKRRCGTGGALKDGVIEIQGDHRDTLVEELEKRGYKVKRTGG